MPPTPDPLTNPYAPPAAPTAALEAGARRTGSRSSYAAERRSVLLLALVTVVTIGIYPSIWYLRRAPFLDSLAADKKVGPLPWVSFALFVALIALAAAHAPEPALRILQLGAGLASLFLAFRVAAILRSDFARSGRSIGVSGGGVFFFGCLYLQHVMNEAADVPAHRPKKRKKRKEKRADAALLDPP